MTETNLFPGSILVTTDFSPASYEAFPYAAEYARALHSNILLFNVFESPAIPISLDRVPLADDIDAIKREAKSKAEGELAGIIAKHFADLQTSSVVLEHYGFSGDAISDFAAKEKTGLIVIASHGYGVVGRILLGSSAERVMRRALCPVLLIPCRVKGKDVAASHLPYRKILVTTDFSGDSRAAWRFAESEARRCSAELTLCNVVEAPLAPQLLESQKLLSVERAQKIQEEYRLALQKKLHEFSSALDSKFARELIDKTYSVPNSIAEYAKTGGFDLIVIAARGGGKGAGLIGGVVERLARQSPCPVLIVPAGDER